MSTYLSEIMSTLFRPSVAALLIAGGAAIIGADSTPNSVRINQADLTDLSCNGLFKPICRAFD